MRALFTLLLLALLAVPGLAAAQEQPSLRVEDSPTSEDFALSWTGEPGPSGYFLVEEAYSAAPGRGGEWRGFADIRTTEMARNSDGEFTQKFTTTGRGTHCFRIRAKSDDVAWSEPACFEREFAAVTTPTQVLPPATGTGAFEAARDAVPTWMLVTAGGILLAVAALNFALFRGYRN